MGKEQEMLSILTIAVKNIVHSCILIRNLKKPNIDVQQDYLLNQE